MVFDFLPSGRRRKREYIPRAIVQKVLERQNFRCAMCGKPLRGLHFHIDHKVPLAMGGSNSIRNLQALCPDCHAKKTREDRMKIARAKKKKKNDLLGIDSGDDIFGFGFSNDTPGFDPQELLFGKERKKSGRRGKKRGRKSEGFDPLDLLFGSGRKKRKRKNDDDILF